MDDDAVAAAICCVVANVIKQKKKRKRSLWTHPWISARCVHGAYHALMQELDQKSFHNFLRMNNSSFELLLSKIAAQITRQDTNMRLSIPPEERLAVTLRYLATGESDAHQSSPLFIFTHQTAAVLLYFKHTQ